MSETVSPELVLVDPELRKKAIALLNELPTPPDALLRPALAATPPAPPRQVPRRPPGGLEQEQPRRPAARRVAPLLVPALLVFGVVVAIAASEIQRDAPTLAPTRVQPAQPHRRVSTPNPPNPRRTTTARAVERLVLAELVVAPKGKLPRGLIDRTTGLARNNLQAVCRRSAAQAFSCVVRPLHHAKGEGLRVRYLRRRDGGGTLTWSRYVGG